MSAIMQGLLTKGELIDETARPPYNYERISSSRDIQGFHFRIYDANDDSIATCYSEGHAKLVVKLINLAVSQTVPS